MTGQKSNKGIIVKQGKVFVKDLPAEKAKRKTTPGIVIKNGKAYKVDLPVEDGLSPQMAEKLNIDPENFKEGVSLYRGFEKMLKDVKMNSTQRAILMVALALDFGRKNPMNALDEAQTV